MTVGLPWDCRPGDPADCRCRSWGTPVNKTVRHLALLGSVAWGLVELFALQRSRYQAWRLRG